VRILGVDVHPLGVDALHARLGDVIERRDRALVLHANAHGLNLAWEQPWLRDFLNSAALVFCDGAGVMLGARLLGRQIPERITYADWMWQLAATAEQRGWSLFLLGAAPGVAERAAARLRQRHPRLKIAGVRNGYFDTAPESSDNRALVAAINAAAPDVLLVGMGMPRQEAWLRENWAQLDVRIGLTGGAVFDYVSGALQRSPEWLNRIGFEWLGRVVIEPRRLWRRYVLGNPRFLARVLRQRLRSGGANP
jgi:N-acetylglucosaminyldiphosphoundecaprenol N-acetyl-beta-D-mannosaminyltransferase